MSHEPVLLECARHLRVLGLRLGASADDVRKQYRALILKHHPDRAGGSPEKEARNTERTIKFNESHDWLQSNQFAWHWASRTTLPTTSTPVWKDVVSPQPTRPTTPTPGTNTTRRPAPPAPRYQQRETQQRYTPPPMQTSRPTPANWEKYVWWGVIILTFITTFAKVVTD